VCLACMGRSIGLGSKISSPDTVAISDLSLYIDPDAQSIFFGGPSVLELSNGQWPMADGRWQALAPASAPA
jgi:hypothetical protein